MSELARRELLLVQQEFKRQLDLALRQEQADKKLFELREELSRQRAVAEQAMSEAADEHELFRQAAALARTSAMRLDVATEELKLQSDADRSFSESMQAVQRRLDEVELLSANTASSLVTEGAHGEQRDESIAQLYALAASCHDAAETSGAALAAAARSMNSTVDRLRLQLRIATLLALAGVLSSVAAMLVIVLG